METHFFNIFCLAIWINNNKLNHMSNFSFIIPVFNEEQTIEKVIIDIQDKCSQIKNIEEFEIIIIDDNSTDSSQKLFKS